MMKKNISADRCGAVFTHNKTVFTGKHHQNIVLIGMPGSGKTAIGKTLSEKLRMDFCDIDEYIENKEGMAIKQIFIRGEEHFRSAETKAVKEVSKNTGIVISTGGGVILNEINMHYLKQNGMIFFINRPIENIIKDIDVTNRPLLSGDVEKLSGIFNKRYALYKKYCDYVIQNNKDVLDVTSKIMRILGVKANENTCD